MARKIVHQLIDDIDGTPLESGEGETLLFSLEGKTYEIDLSPTNAAKLRDDLAPYVKAARRTGTSTPSTPARRRGARSSDLDAIRTWARNAGHKVSDRGRIASHIVAAYEEANA
ncbi:Lsr2 family protein [Microbacterium sp. MEC084]|uniref:histone-like nucleoid-structuring protein Lsr2 n=1 Tax=Microbacterium sp. MEC084 TaxID=1963027 RepID=UPI00106F95F9|nr:Lsr2 family protein [Microbacterium sp. MEC084]MCD1270059.1 Lsr2 family protein [Microbacterium sp. MEC084]